jgi:hypothetical protein
MLNSLFRSVPLRARRPARLALAGATASQLFNASAC